MIDMIFTILYLVIIAQVVLFIIAIRKKYHKVWMFLLCSQVVAYITSIIMTIYCGYYLSGFDSAVGYIAGLAVAIVYIISFFIVISVKIIFYERKCKKNKWIYANPFVLIIATLFILVGVMLNSYDIVVDLNEWIRIDYEFIYVPSYIIGVLILRYRMNKTW